MARKVAGFADKLKKRQDAQTKTCPQCESDIQRVMFVKSVKAESTNSWRINQNMVDVCKCNANEVYPS